MAQTGEQGRLNQTLGQEKRRVEGRRMRPGWFGLMVGTLVCRSKGARFISQSGAHISVVSSPDLVGIHVRGDQSMSLSHHIIDVSLSFSLPTPSLLLSLESNGKYIFR